MRGRRAWLGLAVVALVGFVAVVATSEGVDIAERAPSLPFDLSVSPPEVVPQQTAVERESFEEIENVEQPRSVVGDALGVVALAAIALALGSFIGSRRRAHDPDGRHEDDDVFEIVRDRIDEVAAAVRDDAAAQRAMLLTGDPRNAIVACWARLETLLVNVGVERRPSDVSTDLVARTLGRTDVDAAALSAFAALYREARFSDHAMGEGHREAAVAALDDIHAALRERHGPDQIRM